MNKLFNDITTGIDGKTFDICKVALLISMTVFLILAVVNYSKFDPMAFGGGLGALLAGTGVAVAVKAKTEPQGQQ